MEKFLAGIAVTVAFFTLIHLTERFQKGKIEDLKEEERRWLTGDKE